MSDNRKNDAWDAISDIADLVSKAVSTGNYSSLNSQITGTLGSAADAIHDSVTASVLKEKPFYKTEGAKTYRASSGSYSKAKSKTRRRHANSKRKSEHAGGDGVKSIVPSSIRFFAGLLLSVFSISMLISAIVLVAGEGGAWWVLFVIMAALTAFNLWNVYKGASASARIRRARRILGLMKGRDTITVKEIASAFGRDREWTSRDIKTMIKDGVFTESAYMDDEETAFMTSHEAYEQYLSTMAAYDDRKRTGREKDESVFRKKDLKEYAKMEKESSAIKDGERMKQERLDRETQEVITEGRQFIEHIHQKNDEIPGEEFSEKLDRLERVVTGIFERVEEDPASAPDLHRLMSYYLPTTRKLVDTYASLDRQKVQGENIETAKREIEASLDTINAAFEKFLDSFFQSTAWDVSSDISVMDQMMAQDGLTGGNDFGAAAQVKEKN